MILPGQTTGDLYNNCIGFTALEEHIAYPSALSIRFNAVWWRRFRSNLDGWTGVHFQLQSILIGNVFAIRNNVPSFFGMVLFEKMSSFLSFRNVPYDLCEKNKLNAEFVSFRVSVTHLMNKYVQISILFSIPLLNIQFITAETNKWLCKTPTKTIQIENQ